MPIDLTKTPVYYEIQIAGHLSQERVEWFGLSISVKPAKEGLSITTLSGPVADQAALFGILNCIRDLGLKLISVYLIDPDYQLDQNPE